ncbi:MAG: hypothetical protein OSA98_25850, partial [Rubripirellula sp.]|nr:hypothetical protein [Rubripirellula sp.]
LAGNHLAGNHLAGNHLAGNHLAGEIVVGANVTVAGRYLCSRNRRLSITSGLDLLVAEMVSIISAMVPFCTRLRLIARARMLSGSPFEATEHEVVG